MKRTSTCFPSNNLGKAWALTLALCLFVVPVHAEQVITEQTLHELKRSGLPDETIVALIQASPVQIDTSVTSVLRLSQAGISGPVITALIAKNKPGSATNVASAAAPALRDGAYAIVGGVPQALMPINPSHSKTKGLWKTMVTAGIANQSLVNEYRGAGAPLSLSSEPEFVLAGTHWNVRDMVVVQLTVKDDARYVQVSGGGTVFTHKGGYRDEDVTELVLIAQEGGSYRLRPTHRLEPGQYILTSVSGATPGLGSSGTQGTGWDFAVR